jgi:hypothetical protein
MLKKQSTLFPQDAVKIVNSMQEIFSQTTNIQAGHILLAVLNVLLTKKDSNLES